jgi:type III pantothenate kinase
MNLILDIGNTRTKVALYNCGEIETLKIFDNIMICDIEFMLRGSQNTNNCIVSVTGNFDEHLKKYLQNTFPNLIELNGFTPLPFINQYESKQTQGPDRIASVAGAYSIFPKCNILIIDAGTAITYDFIDSDGNYLGGNISPGIETRFKALNTFTKKLPLLNSDKNFSLIGKNTEQAIINGVQNGAIFEIDGYIDTLNNNYSNLRIIMTGGDAEFLSNKLKNTIFVDANLVLNGLNRILEYNVQK